MLPLIAVVCCFLCWLLPRPTVVGEERIDPFFDGFKRTGSLIVQGIVAGIPVNCSLDSGLSISVIDLELAPKLPQKHREPDVKTGSGLQATKVLSYQNIDRHCLDFPKNTQQLLALDLSDHNADRGVFADVVLGVDYLQPLIFEFRSGRPRLILRSEFVIDNDATSHTLKRDGADHTNASVDLMILGHREFVIATGFSDCVSIPSDWIKRLLMAGEAVRLPDFSVEGSEKSLYVIREIQVLGIKMQNVPVVESDFNLIGMGLMRHLDFSVDFENSVAHVLPSSRSADSFEVDASGLRTVVQPDGGLNISRLMPDSPADKHKLQVGDQLLEIDGQVASELSFWEIRKLLSQAGKTIPLKVKSGDRVRDIQLPLSRIRIPSEVESTFYGR